ncbi:RNA polymerase II C-terminal domain phosphatase-like 1 [Platanthera guangdongensis]|uniref:RNA polymerase II C-terminal domain phosphatase-like 1 n=1 Tax=Platanthera guangdongensis TaxID=2320717 RepID=A0ABR2MJI3_9ASPA
MTRQSPRIYKHMAPDMYRLHYNQVPQCLLWPIGMLSRSKLPPLPFGSTRSTTKLPYSFRGSKHFSQLHRAIKQYDRKTRPALGKGNNHKERALRLQFNRVEIAGEVLGKGIGLTWEDAKIQAAEEALVSLKSKAALVPVLGSGSSRMLPASSNKRLKQDLPQLQRIPS